MRTYTIELRVDFDIDSDTKKEALTKAVNMAAKHLLATALMISDKRKPKVVASYDDFFAGTEEIELADDIYENPDENPFA
jgi:uncharacterized protein YutE (UPF0331/DUF86 family)